MQVVLVLHMHTNTYNHLRPSIPEQRQASNLHAQRQTGKRAGKDQMSDPTHRLWQFSAVLFRSTGPLTESIESIAAPFFKVYVFIAFSLISLVRNGLFFYTTESDTLFNILLEGCRDGQDRHRSDNDQHIFQNKLVPIGVGRL